MGKVPIKNVRVKNLQHMNVVVTVIHANET